MNTPPLSIQLAIGSYQGTCRITKGKKPVVSRVTLRVTRQENQTIHGRITTTGSLKVDQEFAATMTGDQLQFVTANPKKKLTITWLAGVQGDAMQGTYSATRGGLVASFLGKKDQHGDWQCRKERFPFVRRLKSFAKGSLVVAVIIGSMGGIIALSNVGSSPSSPGSAYAPSYDEFYDSSYSNEEGPSTGSYAAPSQPYNNSVRSSTGGSSPHLSDRDLAELGGHVYDYALDRNRVDVKEHYRGETYVRPYDRQPPGGYSLGDRTEAAGWALGAMVIVKGIDYYSPDQVEARRKTEEARQLAEERQREEAVQRIRADAERMRQAKQKPWWRR
jgi:hypothetical protein